MKRPARHDADSLSIVLPAYNESANIARAVEQALVTASRLASQYEVIVVDDGSKDATSRIVEGLARRHRAHVRLIQHSTNQGYGAALRTGFKNARFKLIFFTDSDNQFDMSELEKFIPMTRDYDMIVGFRINRCDPIQRRIYSWFYNRLVGMLFRLSVRDVNCAFKLMTRQVVRAITIECDNFFVNAELLAQARRLNFRIAERGVLHYPRTAGETSVKLSDVPRTLVTLIGVWRGMHKRTSSEVQKLPPLWLSVVALTAALIATDGLVRRIQHFVEQPYDNDFRLNYVAAKIGLTYGWSHIYDLGLEQRVMAAVTPYANGINTMHMYTTPPPLAWLHVPFLLVPVPAGFVAWIVLTTALLVLAWSLVCPGTGFRRVTLLVIAFAIWPMYYAFTIGQTVMITMAGLALCWHFLERKRWAAAGAVLAVAYFIKPQLILLLPVALLVSGRWRPVFYFALASLVLGAISLGSLGEHGISAYVSSLRYTETNVFHSILTYAWFGRGLVASSIEVTLGLVAICVAWYRRDRMDIVFALGVVGSTASAFYLHEYDVPVFLVPAWILLRSRLSVPQRIWLALGILCAQLIGIGQIRPILIWEAGWIVLLGLEPVLLARLGDAHVPGWRPSSTVASASTP